ncbi:hypothetical protein B0A55_06507 [Friedmanniomyces simplex]|uniref:Oxidoreductase n=1 Tax=Friedmanniomyces simplex TaxID=329884 RepID=A0A4V5NGC6_9PEZI|nr:hypothetical protein B0A55_06507 [Friedmanniomyces simplex]
MPAPTTPYQPYADVHKQTNGPGDARPTALQVVEDCGMLGKLTDKTILITGCSAGIGIDTARALYETGAKLLLTARDVPKLEKVIDDIVSHAQHNKTGPKPEAIEIHLDSLASVRKGAEIIKAKSGGKLNILIANAGIMAVPLGKTIDGFESHMGTNHFAHFLLFQLLKPSLLQSAQDSGTASRVITVSSAGHRSSTIRFDDMFWDEDPGAYHKFLGYGQSKTANVYMANSIHRHYADKGVIGLSLHPGAIMTTDLGRHMTKEDFALFGDMSKFAKISKSAEQGAATTVWAAVSPHFEGQNGGRYLDDVGESGPMAAGALVGGAGYAPHAYDEEAEERLWGVSCRAVGEGEGED